jgi:NTP pyrophosphatase (non-canonical NTP hydrolase)|tara:strand:- start:1388 stop:1801 length:414 start_codon:yes stop_codon:yes gene_type:complete
LDEGKTLVKLRKEKYVGAISELAESVFNFHDKFEVPELDRIHDSNNKELVLETLRRRLSFLMEEVGEHSRALNRIELPNAVEEIVDVAYVALGTILVLGEQGDNACHDVSSKNNSKNAGDYVVNPISGKLVRRNKNQ